jgi:hypothetical protein
MPPAPYGPFHRRESPTQSTATAKLQAASGEVWGQPARGSLIPSVKAYRGPLPAGQRGIEFYTQIAPDPASSTPFEVRWYYPQTPGVALCRGNPHDYAVVKAAVTNRQP